jgi:hypothetical protein
MSFMIGTIECKCTNLMEMPTDSGYCVVEGCEENQTFYGEHTMSRLHAWAEAHTEIHIQKATELEEKANSLVQYGNSLPKGVTTEAFAEAMLLRMEARKIRGYLTPTPAEGSKRT